MGQVEEMAAIVQNDANTALPFFSTEAWRIIDAWLDDSEKELIEALISRPQGDEFLRGRIKSLRYLRQLPDVFKKIAESAPPEKDSAQEASTEAER